MGRLWAGLVSGVWVLVLFVALFGVVLNVPVVWGSGTIYIRADGSIEPPTAPIESADNVTYTFTDNINDSIVIEKSSIIVDGNRHTLQGSGSENGFSLCAVDNVTIKNTNIKGFGYGIFLGSSDYNTFSWNNITNSSVGVAIGNSSYNIFVTNNILSNQVGVYLFYSSNNNTVYGSNIANNSEFGIYLDQSEKNVFFNNNVTNNNCGIQLWCGSNNTISGNSVTNNFEYGVWLWYSTWNSLSGNNLANNPNGIHLWYTSDNNVLSENNVTSSQFGIYLCKRSSNNTIYGNNVTNNGYGVYLDQTSNNTLRKNSMVGNIYNFGAYGGELQFLFHDVNPSNTVDGNPIYYLVNSQNIDVPSNAGYVALVNSTNITIKGLELKNNGQGILLVQTTDSLIKSNNITHTKSGVWLCDSSNNTIHGNNITADNGCGIKFDRSWGNTIYENDITSNINGIWLSLSHGDVFRSNKIANNLYSLKVDGWDISDFINDIDCSNMIDGKPVYYWINVRDATVPLDSGYVALINCTSIAVENLTLSKNGEGILLAFTKNSTITENNIINNSVGISLLRSSNNTIFDNDIASNSNYGVYLKNSSSNVIYHNNFVNNQQRVYTYPWIPSTNLWDDGYPSGGNYWSDYTCVDSLSGPFQNETGSDGICDSSFPWGLPPDRYPLMAPFSTFDAGVWNGEAYNVDVVSNSTVSGFYFNPDEGAFIRFSVTGENETVGFCRVTIPKSLLWVENGWTIFVGDQPITNYTIIPDENYTYIYFTYNHSIRTVIIQGTHVIPEFPSSLILPIFMIITLLAAIAYKRKRPPL